MHVIVLQGRGNSGKTTILKRLIKALGLIVQNESAPDWRACGTVNGKTIVITTSGDTEEEIKKNIEYCKERSEVDIFVTASRTRGGSINALRKEFPKLQICKRKTLGDDDDAVKTLMGAISSLL